MQSIRNLKAFCLCLIVLFSAVHLRADVTGSILGYVRDKSGAVLPNATVTVIQTSTGYTRTATIGRVGPVQHSCFASRKLQIDRRGRGFPEGSH